MLDAARRIIYPDTVEDMKRSAFRGPVARSEEKKALRQASSNHAAWP